MSILTAPSGTKTSVDYLIIGAGPAGLQLGYYLEQAGRDYLLLEAGDAPATFFKTFPRHRKMISINKVYTGYDDTEINLRWDWHSLLSESSEMLFKDYSRHYFPAADDFVSYCADFANHFKLKIKYGTRVISVSKGDEFRVLDSKGNLYFSQRLIVATGISKPYIPPISGIELAEPYTTVSVEPEEFANQRVLVIGKGNSAFETADNLIGTTALIHVASPHPLRLAWQSHYVGHLRAINNNFLDTYQLKSQNAVLDATIEKMERQNGQIIVSVSYTHAHGENEELAYDRVLLCTGFRFDDAIFDDSCRPVLTINDRFPAQSSEWESTNIKDLYFAGVLTQVRDYKKSTSAFIHGFRYNARVLHHIFEQKYHGNPWPSRSLNPTPEGLTDAVIARVNRTSALWQQFGYLCDLITVSDQEVTYYEEMAVDYVQDSHFGQHEHYYTITLEYGPNHDAADPFNVTRIERHDVDRAEQSNFLHPVIRRFAGPVQISEHHIIEDLAAEWLEDVHINPLHNFLASDLHMKSPAVV